MAKDDEEYSPLGNIGFGILLILAGIFCYFWFAHLETDGGHIRTHVLIILVYNMLGKWGVLGVVGGLGALLTVVGIKGLMAGEQPQQEQPQDGRRG